MPKEDDILDAVQRKIGIARYHLQELRSELDVANRADAYIAPLSVQAHLEGLVAAADAAADKTARLKRRLQGVALPDGSSAYEKFDTWRSDALVQHVQLLRNLALHSVYFKRPVGHTWSVPELGESGYQGPFELEPYGEAIVARLDSLEGILASA